MKKRIIILAGMLMGLLALGTGGCSSGGICYWGGKAYTRNLQTGEMMSWAYKPPEGRGLKFGYIVPTSCSHMGWGLSNFSLSNINIDCSSINVGCVGVK